MAGRFSCGQHTLGGLLLVGLSSSGSHEIDWRGRLWTGALDDARASFGNRLAQAGPTRPSFSLTSSFEDSEMVEGREKEVRELCDCDTLSPRHMVLVA